MKRVWYKIFVALLTLFSLISCRKSVSPRVETLSLAVPYEVATLDPHAKSKLSDLALLSHFYEGLVSLAHDMTIQPSLAKYWETPDPRTWVFHLNQGVRFHNGKVLDSEDVVYSLRRVLTEKGLQRTGYVINLEEVKALDPLTVQVRTRRPVSILLNKLVFIPIIPKGIDQKKLVDHVNGTGPYKLEQWDRNAKVITMSRYEQYWKTKPAAKHVTMFLSQSPKQAFERLQSGGCQFVQCNSRKLAAEAMKNTGFQVKMHDSLYVKYIGFNFSEGANSWCNLSWNPFRDLRVRQAVHYGIDRSRLVSRLDIFASPASQPLPPFTFGFNASIPMPPYSTPRARSLLQDAGITDGLQATLLTRDMFAETAAEVQKQLAEVNVRIEPKSLPDNDYFAAIQRKEFSIYLSRFGCVTGDASDILDITMHSTNLERGYGMQNYGGYSNPELDQAIEESSEIQSIDRRKARLQEIMATLIKDLAWIPLYIDQDVYIFQRRLQWTPRNDGFILASEIMIAN